MIHAQSPPQKSVAYFFLKSKDESMEKGLITITLFTRLVRELTFFTGRKIQIDVETWWVQIADIEMGAATEKVKNRPNCMEKYAVSKEVFQHLFLLSKECPDELYSIIPYYLTASQEMYLHWQELKS